MWLLRSKRISGLAWISKKRNGVQIAAWATQAPCDTCSWSRSQAASPSVAAQPTAIQRVVGVYKSYQKRVSTSSRRKTSAAVFNATMQTVQACRGQGACSQSCTKSMIAPRHLAFAGPI